MLKQKQQVNLEVKAAGLIASYDVAHKNMQEDISKLKAELQLPIEQVNQLDLATKAIASVEKKLSKYQKQFAEVQEESSKLTEEYRKRVYGRYAMITTMHTEIDELTATIERIRLELTSKNLRTTFEKADDRIKKGTAAMQEISLVFSTPQVKIKVTPRTLEAAEKANEDAQQTAELTRRALESMRKLAAPNPN